MKYKCLNKVTYILGDHLVTTIRQKDIMQIKQWRNEQMDVLRQNIPLTDEDQISYYDNVILPSINSDNPRVILFSYLYRDSCIGYGGLTNVDWISKRAEISFLINTDFIGDKDNYQEKFDVFLKLMKMIAFEDVGFNRLFTETYDIRPYHIEVLENNGFEFEGRMRKHVFLKKQGGFIDSLIHGCLEGSKDV